MSSLWRLAGLLFQLSSVIWNASTTTLPPIKKYYFLFSFLWPFCLLQMPFKISKGPWVLMPMMSEATASFTWIKKSNLWITNVKKKKKSLLIWLGWDRYPPCQDPQTGISKTHFMWLYLKQVTSDAVCQHQLQKWSQFTPKCSPNPSSPTHLSLPEKMANYVRALCIHLFVVKTQQGVSSEMGKGWEGEAFCWERLEVWLWRGGQPAGWSRLIRCSFHLALLRLKD